MEFPTYRGRGRGNFIPRGRGFFPRGRGFRGTRGRYNKGFTLIDNN